MIYPAKPIWDDSMKFKIGVITALKKFKRTCPYSVGYEARKAGLQTLLEELGTAYQMEVPVLRFTEPEKETSFESYYMPEGHVIIMNGRLSIITFLHEFAHSQGKNETGAVRWSLSLFKRCYPKAFEKLIADGHCLVLPTQPTN
jgi:hypothetical protein